MAGVLWMKKIPLDFALGWGLWSAPEHLKCWDAQMCVFESFWAASYFSFLVISATLEPNSHKSAKLWSKQSCTECSGPRSCWNVVGNCCVGHRSAFTGSVQVPGAAVSRAGSGAVPAAPPQDTAESISHRWALFGRTHPRKGQHWQLCQEQLRVRGWECAPAPGENVVQQDLPAGQCRTPCWRMWRFPEGSVATESSCRGTFNLKDCSPWRGPGWSRGKVWEGRSSREELTRCHYALCLWAA